MNKIVVKEKIGEKGVYLFHFEHHQVRVIEKDGEPWLVAKDVSEILGYDQTSNMLKRLDDDEVLKIASSFLNHANSMAREFVLINESGIYNAVLGSKKQDAKKFRKWLTVEVLPSIRKNGEFMSDAWKNRLMERVVDLIEKQIDRLDLYEKKLNLIDQMLNETYSDDEYDEEYILPEHDVPEYTDRSGIDNHSRHFLYTEGFKRKK